MAEADTSLLLAGTVPPSGPEASSKAAAPRNFQTDRIGPGDALTRVSRRATRRRAEAQHASQPIRATPRTREFAYARCLERTGRRSSEMSEVLRLRNAISLKRESLVAC